MSKGKVWNKGKRNGGGGPPAATGSIMGINVSNSGNENNADTNRIDRVERVNRENWVVRPARVKREENHEE